MGPIIKSGFFLLILTLAGTSLAQRPTEMDVYNAPTDDKSCGADECYQFCVPFNFNGTGLIGRDCSASFTKNNVEMIKRKMDLVKSTDAKFTPPKTGFDANRFLDNLVPQMCKSAARQLKDLREKIAELEKAASGNSCPTATSDQQNQSGAKK